MPPVPVFISVLLFRFGLSQFVFCASISFLPVPVFCSANIAVSALFALGKGLYLRVFTS